MAKGPPSLVVRNKATRATLHLRGNHAKLHQASPIKFNNIIAQKYAFKTKIKDQCALIRGLKITLTGKI